MTSNKLENFLRLVGWFSWKAAVILTQVLGDVQAVCQAAVSTFGKCPERLVILCSEPPTVRGPCFRYFIVDTYRCSREGGSEAWLHLTAVKCVCGMCRHHCVAVAMWMVKAGRWQPVSALWREICQFALLVCVIIRLLTSVCRVEMKWSTMYCCQPKVCSLVLLRLEYLNCLKFDYIDACPEYVILVKGFTLTL